MQNVSTECILRARNNLNLFFIVTARFGDGKVRCAKRRCEC